ncbi:MAG: sigma 54-interacting transcriptional regulator [Syntrophales bacterium]|nr:sigma 54-interacting transcriptional regulator [Syntrophales bacterium]MDD5643580.1 sigma 54-interacting transcriptional regulator [Syntrophales bacterium]
MSFPADFATGKFVVDLKNLEPLLDHLQEGVIGHDPYRRIFFFNRAAAAMTGFTAAEVLGRDCHEVFGGPLCGKQCSFCGGAPDSWTELNYPLNIVTRKGEPKQVEMSVVGLKDAAGRFAGVLAAIKDITSLVGLKLWTGEATGFAGIVGRDPQMLQIFKQISRLAGNGYPVLITGETGTGKELVAAAIHSESRRARGPFVPVNCGALPEGVVESELFGHVKGAFSGALRDKKGRFELAHGGTIFLDEVAELPKNMQVKLLRVLENGAFERVGGERTITVDVRIISATNRDLKREIEKRKFRRDLFYRLNVVPLQVPPLRERQGDIPLLVDFFLQSARKRGRQVPRFSPEALALLQRYPWPGNVRELQNAVHYALARSDRETMGPEELPQEIREEGARRGPARKLNLEAVAAALRQCGGNKAKAARLLGVGRATLYRFLMSQETPMSHG